MTSPKGSGILPGTVTFQWTAGTGALEYRLDVGSTKGATNVYSQSAGLNRSATVSNIPRSGGTIFVRLWTRSAGGWQFNDYTYRVPR